VTSPDTLPAERAADLAAMHEALALAHDGIGLTDPNPRVGCVIHSADGRVIGRGHTQAAGDAHAEVMALRDARARGHDPRGATVYVTLEPCAHHGRTPPCVLALIEAGVARVVVAVGDPFPQVAGAGIEALHRAGIAVQTGLLAEPARELNIGFFSRVLRGRPWLRLKVAASLDGRTALDDGTSQWITSEAARTDGHAWRKRAGAVLTGIGTVRDDNPRLDVRLVPTARQPLRVVVDSQLGIDPAARILQPPGPALVYTASDDAARQQVLERAQVEVARLPATAEGKTDLNALLRDLARRGINELHVEAGHKLNGSLVRAGLVDEVLLYQAPRLIGPGREIAALAPLARLDQAVALEYLDVRRIGPDLRIVARPPGRAQF
jgi:diaminohydroxyphosphoribosylaminopyrimidine deaminase/5-amino-6-(5-phosphoribosylamino)uracil reductase